MKLDTSPYFALLSSTQKEDKVLSRLSDEYKTVSEMSDAERQFLNALVLRQQPKKLLEIGVSAGSSSVVLLNAVKGTAKAKLHSIDYAENYYLDETRKTGYIVDSYPELAHKWQLYTGGLALDFMDSIGGDIDFCFIDAAHMNPGEILDTLMVLPYLKDDAIIVYHDINLPTFVHKVTYDINRTLTNNLLMSAVHGQKIMLKDFKWGHDLRTHFPNMGAIQLNKNSKLCVFDIFNLLTLRWSYMPSEDEQKAILRFLSRHYDQYFVDYTKRVFTYQRSHFKLSNRVRARRYVKRMAIAAVGQKQYATLVAKLSRR